MDSDCTWTLLRREMDRWKSPERPAFVAGDLVAYQERHQMGDDALAEFLSCSEEQLSLLAMVRRPDPARADYRSQIERIAEYVGVRGDRLAHILSE